MCGHGLLEEQLRVVVVTVVVDGNVQTWGGVVLA